MSNPIYIYQLIYQAKTQPVPANEDIARLEWTIIWTEPVRIKQGLASHRQSFLAFSPTPVAAPTGTGDLLWHSPWSSVMVQNVMLGEG